MSIRGDQVNPEGHESGILDLEGTSTPGSSDNLNFSLEGVYNGDLNDLQYHALCLLRTGEE